MSGPGSFEILAYESTPLGPLCLRRRELIAEPGTVITEVTLNHEFLMSSYNTESERALSSMALERHEGQDLSVLVGGLGLGYTAREALVSPRVSCVEVVEFLPQVIDWLERDLFPLASELSADDRFSVRRGDVYAELLAEPTRPHDLILIDVDHSPDEQLDSSSAAFYQRDGLLRARAHLNPGGILAVWSYDGSEPFEAALREVFDEVDVPVIVWENRLVDSRQEDRLFLARRN